MADHTIRIVVVQSGAQQAANDISGIGASGTSSANAIWDLNKAIRALGLGYGISSLIREFSDLADSYTVFKNRIALTTDSQSEQTQIMNELIGVAEQTGQSLDTVGKAYEQLRLATSDMNLTNEQVIGLTDTLATAFMESGNSAGASAALISQFTVALESGNISGRQFRTVIINNTFLMNELAKAAGKTVAQLKEMASQTGGLDAEYLANLAFVAGPDIQQKRDSGDISPTVGQQLENLKTQIADAFGAAAIKGFTDILSEVSKGLFIVSDALNEVYYARKQLTNLLGGGLSDADASKAGANADQLVQDLADLRYTGPNEKTSRDIASQQAVQDRTNADAVAAQARLGSFPDTLKADQQDNLDKLTQELTLKQRLAAEGLESGPDEIASLLAQNQLIKDKIISTTRYGELIAEQYKNAKEDSPSKADFVAVNTALNSQGKKVVSDDVYNSITAIAAQTAQYKLQDAVVKQLGGTAAELEDKIKAIEDLGDPFGNNQEKSASAAYFNDVRTHLVQQLNDKRQIAQLSVLTDEAGAKAQIALTKLIETSGSMSKADQATDLAYLTKKYADEQQIAQLQVRTDDAHSKAMIELLQLQEQNGQLSASDAKLTLDSLTAQIGMQQKLKELQARTDAGGGYGAALLELQDKATNTGKQIEQTMTDAFGGAEDAIVQFVETGKLSFNSLVDSILGDLTKLLLQQAVEAPFLAFLGAGAGNSGGLFSGLLGSISANTPIPSPIAHATGGYTSPGTPYLVGERGPELFTPGNGGGNITPAGQFGKAPEVHVHIANISDPNEISKFLNTSAGQDAIVNTIRKNRSAVKQATG